MDGKELLRGIPSVDQLLKEEDLASLRDVPRALIVETVREKLALVRENILRGDQTNFKTADIVRDSVETIRWKCDGSLKRVINATGVVLHTNLGRAILSLEARQAVSAVAEGYSNLEYDLLSGGRGTRYSHTDHLLRFLTGAEASMVVNNNAAAVMLVLNTLARGREVVVSRGELVEIGGGFRIPEVLAHSGARLVEVGTTNKTNIKDYERAISDDTAALLKVHTSNFKIVGFTHSVSIREMKGLADAYRLPVIEDLGSGSMMEYLANGVEPEPTVRQSIDAGADLVTFSGDKLLGGPQAGIIAGSRELIALMEANPLTRALRVDKLTLAALEATLRQYLDPEKAVANIPALEMLNRAEPLLRQMAENLLAKLQSIGETKARIEIRDDNSFVGGGAVPGTELPTKVIAILPAGVTAAGLARRLRRGRVPVIGRIQNDWYLLDLRTVRENELNELAGAVREAFSEGEETSK